MYTKLSWQLTSPPCSAVKRLPLTARPRVCYLGCLKQGFKSVQVLFNGIEAVMMLTFDNSDIADPAARVPAQTAT